MRFAIVASVRALDFAAATLDLVILFPLAIFPPYDVDETIVSASLGLICSDENKAAWLVVFCTACDNNDILGIITIVKLRPDIISFYMLYEFPLSCDGKNCDNSYQEGFDHSLCKYDIMKYMIKQVYTNITKEELDEDNMQLDVTYLQLAVKKMDYEFIDYLLPLYDTDLPIDDILCSAIIKLPFETIKKILAITSPSSFITGAQSALERAYIEDDYTIASYLMGLLESQEQVQILIDYVIKPINWYHCVHQYLQYCNRPYSACKCENIRGRRSEFNDLTEQKYV
jgi:hypothetical protein